MLGMTSCIHVFILGKTLLDTIRLNMLPASDLRGLPQYSAGLGTPPWERMPAAETGADAEALRHSLMGRLIPMARFQLLEGGMLHSTAGIEAVPISEHGAADPSVVVYPNKSSKNGFVACGLSFMSVWETAVGALTGLCRAASRTKRNTRPRFRLLRRSSVPLPQKRPCRTLGRRH